MGEEEEVEGCREERHADLSTEAEESKVNHWFCDEHTARVWQHNTKVCVCVCVFRRFFSFREVRQEPGTSNVLTARDCRAISPAGSTGA